MVDRKFEKMTKPESSKASIDQIQTNRENIELKVDKLEKIVKNQDKEIFKNIYQHYAKKMQNPNLEEETFQSDIQLKLQKELLELGQIQQVMKDIEMHLQDEIKNLKKQCN